LVALKDGGDRIKAVMLIQDGEFERVGGSVTLKVDVRIVAATNRNLEQEVAKGRFREDLWYRLNVFPSTMPPLRDRIGDIPLLVEFYVQKISKRLGNRVDIIPTSVIHALQAYHWTGNVRESKNVLERAVINSSGPKLRLVDELKKPFKDLSASQRTLEAVEREYIVRVLEQTHWKVGAKTARLKSLGSTAAPWAPACANSISESHRSRIAWERTARCTPGRSPSVHPMQRPAIRRADRKGSYVTNDQI
jgi:transcriptional regulator with GAF, ATPase, and Fis domain